jgi:hypothetical protein
VGAKTGLDWCGKSCPYRDSIPGPSSPWRVAIPTELSRSFFHKMHLQSLASQSALNGLEAPCYSYAPLLQHFLSFSTVFVCFFKWPCVVETETANGICQGLSSELKQACYLKEAELEAVNG